MPLKCETNLLQNMAEFNRFLEFIKQHQVKSYLEIGSKHGGSFWRISHVLPRGARVVSVDLPHGDGSFKKNEPNLRACVDELARRGYDAHLFLGNSTDPEIVEKVRQLGPFDLVFIDGSHLEPDIWKDWANYGAMAEIVAFHDISHQWLPHKPPDKNIIEVPKVWNKLKQEYEHIEIRHEQYYNGIGILWRSRKTAAAA